MGNKYYQPGVERAERVSDLFAAIAPRYDLINDLQSFGLHRVWKRRLVRLAAPQPGEKGLDLCCGTGDIAIALAQTGAEVVGLDFSEPMLAVARAKAEVLGLESKVSSESRAGCHRSGAGVPAAETGVSPANPHAGETPAPLQPPHFIQGDAQQVPFPDNHFDVVTVGYGLRNLASWETGLEEMLRVVKPGGRLLVLEFGKPDNALWRGVYFSYLRWLVPILGKLFCRDSQAYAYIFESLMHYPAQRGIALKMQELNCEAVRIVNLLGGVMSINYARKQGQPIT